MLDLDSDNDDVDLSDCRNVLSELLVHGPEAEISLIGTTSGGKG